MNIDEKKEVQIFAKLALVIILLTSAIGYFLYTILPSEAELAKAQGKKVELYLQVSQFEIFFESLNAYVALYVSGEKTIDDVNDQFQILESKSNILSNPSPLTDHLKHIAEYREDFPYVRDFVEHLAADLKKLPEDRKISQKIFRDFDNVRPKLKNVANHTRITDLEYLRIGELDYAQKRKWFYIGSALFWLFANVTFISLMVTYRRMRRYYIAEKNAKIAIENATMAKHAFWGMIGHELKTPLQNIIGSLDFLKVRKFDKKDTEVIDSLSNSVKHLEMQLRDLTDYARLDAGKLPRKDTTFDASKMLSLTAEEFRSMAEEKKLSYIVEIQKCDFEVVSDALRVQQIANNLIVNAIKYTVTGQVAVRLKYEDDRDGKISFVIIVEDTGPGIKPEDMPTLFEPFIQVDNGNARRHDGTGMGLAIVRELVDLLGGTITVTSTVGGGSAFEARFPSKKVMAISDNNQPKNCKLLSSVQILLVDDNASVRESLSRILLQLNYMCDTAESGTEALNQLMNKHYDAVLLDINMPDINGFVVAQKIRAMPCQNKDVPIIWISAASPQVHTSEQRAMLSNFLEKPIHSEELDEMIKATLDLD